MITGLHHVGLGVEDIDAEIAVYEQLGFDVLSRSEYKSMKAKTAMLRNGTALVELFQFADSTSELAGKIKKHSAFATDNLEADLQIFLNVGYELAIPIDDGDVVRRYAYVKDKAGNFIELCEPLD
jgi:catechol 2,3-dioxygenase-like lactoylglutathione lyase family enzyme